MIFPLRWNSPEALSEGKARLCSESRRKGMAGPGTAEKGTATGKARKCHAQQGKCDDEHGEGGALPGWARPRKSAAMIRMATEERRRDRPRQSSAELCVGSAPMRKHGGGMERKDVDLMRKGKDWAGEA